MRICVHGLGAVGGMIGLFVSRAMGERVFARVRRREQAEKLSKGFRVRGAIEGSYDVVASLEPPSQRCDYTLVATKAYDAPMAIEEASSYSDTIVALSNGFGAVERAIERGIRVIAGIVEYGVVRLSDSEVEVRSIGRIVLGAPPHSAADPLPLAEALRRGGAIVEMVENIEGWRWLKGIANSAINPVTAILRAENGVILSDEILPLVRCVVEEGAAVARAIGVDLPVDPFEYVLELARRTARNRSSMLQDIEACRKTEVEEINGYIARMAESLGIEARCTSTLRHLVKQLEALCRARHGE